MYFPLQLGRRGSVGLMAAIFGLVLLCFGGVGVDLERAWLVRGRLQTALDAAGLSSARTYAQSSCTTTCTDVNSTALFWAEFGRNNDINGTGGIGFMGATATSPVFTPIDSAHLRITATATVPTMMLGPLALYTGLSPAASVSMTVSTVVQRVGTGLELSLVLDDTASMAQSDGSTSQTKIQALQGAVSTLLDILYGTDQNGNKNDTLVGLNVAVVPFTVGINVGKSNIGFVTRSPTYAPATWTQYWQGCVESRYGSGNDVTEANPYTVPFEPYFSPDTYNKSGSKPCSINGYSYSNGVCMGDNDWSNASLAESQNPLNETGTAFGSNQLVPSPNQSCPATPILPLTASRTTVNQTVNAMTAPPGIGTIIGLGVQGGWFTLSPSWRGSSGWGNATLPQNYASSSTPPNPPIQKVIVLLSDGSSDWLGYPQVSPTDESNGKADMFYMAYGRPSRYGSFLTTTGNPNSDEQTNATYLDSLLDSEWNQTCTNVKKQGIVIFVVGLSPASGDVPKLQSCATDSAHYISSPTAANLQSAFQNVGNQLASLLIAQ